MPSYLSAALPEPVTVFGNVLQPFSLGHELVLARLGFSARKGIDLPLTADETLLVIYVCSSPWLEAWDAICFSDWEQEIKDWALQIAEAGVNVTGNEARDWIQFYLSRGFAEPRVQFKEPGKGKSQVPQIEMVIQTLCGQCGMREDDVMAMSRPLAMWRFWSFLELSGKYGVTVIDEQSAVAEALRKKVEELRKEEDASP